MSSSSLDVPTNAISARRLVASQLNEAATRQLLTSQRRLLAGQGVPGRATSVPGGKASGRAGRILGPGGTPPRELHLGGDERRARRAACLSPDDGLAGDPQ
jgi:hypothetical protein